MFFYLFIYLFYRQMENWRIQDFMQNENETKRQTDSQTRVYITQRNKNITNCRKRKEKIFMFIVLMRVKMNAQ